MAPLDDKTREQIVARVLAAREQRPQRLNQMKERQQQGLEVARKCAQILKEKFGAQRIVLFGSMLNPERMWWGSDIDLAVWGLPEEDFFKAGAALEGGHDFSIDLIEAQYARPHILDAIDKGMDL
jgi:predicted nucleotidyltransferase